MSTPILERIRNVFTDHIAKEKSVEEARLKQHLASLGMVADQTRNARQRIIQELDTFRTELPQRWLQDITVHRVPTAMADAYFTAQITLYNRIAEHFQTAGNDGVLSFPELPTLIDADVYRRSVYWYAEVSQNATDSIEQRQAQTPLEVDNPPTWIPKESSNGHLRSHHFEQAQDLGTGVGV